jgi:hypothetical protein
LREPAAVPRVNIGRVHGAIAGFDGVTLVYWPVRIAVCACDATEEGSTPNALSQISLSTNAAAAYGAAHCDCCIGLNFGSHVSCFDHRLPRTSKRGV